MFFMRALLSELCVPLDWQLTSQSAASKIGRFLRGRGKKVLEFDDYLTDHGNYSRD
jgi:hypothetical protein